MSAGRLIRQRHAQSILYQAHLPIYLLRWSLLRVTGIAERASTCVFHKRNGAAPGNHLSVSVSNIYCFQLFICPDVEGQSVREMSAADLLMDVIIIGAGSIAAAYSLAFAGQRLQTITGSAVPSASALGIISTYAVKTEASQHSELL